MLQSAMTRSVVLYCMYCSGIVCIVVVLYCMYCSGIVYNYCNGIVMVLYVVWYCRMCPVDGPDWS